MGVSRPRVASATIAASVVCCIVLAGCTPAATTVPMSSSAAEPVYENLMPDGSAHAILDEETETIHLPMDSYYMTSREALMVQHVNDLRIDECLADSGRSYSPSRADWAASVSAPDRRYGIWNAETAARYGYELPPDPYLDSVMRLVEGDSSLTPAQIGAQDQCIASIDTLPVINYGSGFYNDATAFMKVADDGVAAGAAATGRDDVYSQTHQAYSACMGEQAIMLIGDGQGWMPVLPEELEQQVKVAVIDVACHESADVVQTLTDVEARYQAAYIAAHEADLVAVQNEVDGIVDEAAEYLATHG